MKNRRSMGRIFSLMVNIDYFWVLWKMDKGIVENLNVFKQCRKIEKYIYDFVIIFVL